MFRNYSRYAFANRKRYPSFRKPTRRSTKPRLGNGGYSSIPRYVSSRPNASYSTLTPQSMRVCLKYTAIYTITTTSGLSSDQKFRLNSIFDSDYTGSGHQPRGHDQWSFLYEKYRVDACNIRLDCGSTSTGGYVSIVGDHSVTSISDATQAPEMQNSITRTVQAGATTTVSKHFSLPALSGLTKSQYEADDLNQALMSNDPGNQLIGHIVFVSSDVASVGVLNLMVTLTYYCTLFQPVQVAQS